MDAERGDGVLAALESELATSTRESVGGTSVGEVVIGRSDCGVTSWGQTCAGTIGGRDGEGPSGAFGLAPPAGEVTASARIAESIRLISKLAASDRGGVSSSMVIAVVEPGRNG